MLQNTFTFCGQCTDSGDGSTLFALAKLIQEKNMKRTNYLIGSCTLHNIQTALWNDVINVIQKSRRASSYMVVAGRYMRFQFQGINACLVEDL